MKLAALLFSFILRAWEKKEALAVNYFFSTYIVQLTYMQYIYIVYSATTLKGWLELKTDSFSSRGAR